MMMTTTPRDYRFLVPLLGIVVLIISLTNFLILVPYAILVLIATLLEAAQHNAVVRGNNRRDKEWEVVDVWRHQSPMLSVDYKNGIIASCFSDGKVSVYREDQHRRSATSSSFLAATIRARARPFVHGAVGSIRWDRMMTGSRAEEEEAEVQRVRSSKIVASSYSLDEGAIYSPEAFSIVPTARNEIDSAPRFNLLHHHHNEQQQQPPSIVIPPPRVSPEEEDQGDPTTDDDTSRARRISAALARQRREIESAVQYRSVAIHSTTTPTTATSRPRVKVVSVSLSGDGTKALFGCDDWVARLYDTRTSREIKELKGHRDICRTVCLSRDGSRAITGSYDTDVRYWNCETSECIFVLRGHERDVCCVALNRSEGDGEVEGESRLPRTAASSSADRTCRVWNLRNGQTLAILQGHQDVVKCVAFDGNLLLTGSFDFCSMLWSLEGLMESFVAAPPVVTSSSSLASSLPMARMVKKFENHLWFVQCVALSKSKSRGVTAALDGCLTLLELDTGREIKRIYPSNSRGITSLSFVTPCFSFVLVGTEDMQSILVDLFPQERWKLAWLAHGAAKVRKGGLPIEILRKIRDALF